VKLVEGTWRDGVPKAAAADPNVEGGPLLFEETSYSLLLSARGGHRVALSHRDPRLLRGISTAQDGATAHGAVNFRSQVGRSRFTVLVDDQPEFDFEVEVSPSKLDYETDYAELTAEVQAILRGLVLEYLASTYEGASLEGSGGSTDLEWALLLRHIVDELERALQYVARQPTRGLRRRSELVRIDRLRRSDSSVRQAVLRGRGKGPLQAVASGFYAKQHLPERQAKPTLDTPEHRWLASRVAAARRRLAALLRRTRAHAGRDDRRRTPARTKQALHELDRLEARLNRLLRLEPLEAAQGPPPHGFSSLQLQGAPGYKEAYHACVSLARGLRLTGGPVELSLKELHRLYEYWCFLSIVDLVGELLGQRLPAKQLLSVEQDGLRVLLRKGKQQKVVFGLRGQDELAVVYSPSFSGADFISTQTPDISLTLSRDGWPTVRLVLDAKYRVESNETYVAQMGAPGPPFDSINVLHRYRDAILEREPGTHSTARGSRTVVEGVALYPLSGMEANDFDQTRMWTSLDRLGIGALPFLPSEKEYVRRWLADVLRRTGWTVADRYIPSANRERLQAWREAASQAVLVGVLRNESQQHLRWIRENDLYYTPFTPSQSLQLSARWVAFYEGANGADPSSVSLVAPIVAIEVQRREEIETPWPSRPGSGGEDMVVYRLGRVKELATPVRNLRGERVSTNRWTSRLGLDRASRLEELLLETEPDWRFYDELRQRGVAFEVRPGRPMGRQADDPRGRAWFDLFDGVRVQYQGLAGWLVRAGDAGEHYPTLAEVVRAVI